MVINSLQGSLSTSGSVVSSVFLLVDLKLVAFLGLKQSEFDSCYKSESQGIASTPDKPYWLLIDRMLPDLGFICDDDESNNAILESFRVNWLNWRGQIICRHKTLDEILEIVLVGRCWNDLEYQKLWIERFVSQGDDSYCYLSDSGHTLQICREETLEEAKQRTWHII